MDFAWDRSAHGKEGIKGGGQEGGRPALHVERERYSNERQIESNKERQDSGQTLKNVRMSIRVSHVSSTSPTVPFQKRIIG